MSQTKVKADGFDVDVISGNTALAETPASTDEIIISDGGTLKRLDFAHIYNTPAFQANAGSTDQSISHNTWTKLTLGTEDFDTDSAFGSNKFTVPSGEGGKYMFGYGTCINNLDDGEKLQIKLYKNGSSVNSSQNRIIAPTNNQLYYLQATSVLVLSAADYIELYMAHEEGGSQDTNSDHVFLYGYKLIGV
tara:strand:+ start:895 stop:1467 length:573 start_codon:yes stop_codon:yes gene_type:complete